METGLGGEGGGGEGGFTDNALCKVNEDEDRNWKRKVYGEQQWNSEKWRNRENEYKRMHM